ncbi:MAG TPA: septum site-determining protein MinC [Bacillota bacterium]|nr:septum site-determining protein MinC [Bacillota bacterium]HOL09353.1 septum site-determining protein MinC [Bacillota bacterium]HPO97098.1 septum site-determining protein MinC [Bacillota bacterium]
MINFNKKIPNNTDDHTDNHTDKVIFKGYRNGLKLIIPETVSFDECLTELQNQLDKSRSFFKGAVIRIQLGNRKLSESEYAAIEKILTDNGLVLQGIVEEPNLKKQPVKKPEPREDGIRTITINKTLRSGQKVEYDGNILILGDVNPGAEVIASGDIIVYGRLRGTAHAGAEGDPTAKIMAFQLNPVQIRIAGIITRDSEKTKKSKIKAFSPEVALIKEGLIVVEKIKL